MVLGIAVTTLAALIAVEIAAGSRSTVSTSGAPPALLAVLAIIAPLVVIGRLSRHRQVSIRTLLGAISAYLLIPVAFYYLFLTVAAFQDQTFFGHAEPTTSFMYFSLTTLTTLGYGDLAPASHIGRLFATSEAIIGPVYLVTVVALLVGLLASQWRGTHTAPDASETPLAGTDADHDS